VFIGKPVPAAVLIDRDEIVNKLVKDISNSRIHPSFALLGYRRIGKTSILLKVKEELERRQLVVVYFDVKERATDPEGFLRDLEEELLSAYSNHLGGFQKVALKASGLPRAIAQKVIDLVSSVESFGVELSPDGTIMPKIKLGDKSEEDFAKLFRSVFKTADVIAERAKKRVVLIFDEFQDILRLKEYKGLKNVLDLYRGALQKRGNVCHIISGSRVHMLRSIFEEPGSPLFQHFTSETIGDLDESYATKLFSSVVENREIGVGKEELRKSGKKIFSLVGGHPYYIILLAEAWDGKSSLENTFERLIAAPTGSLYIYANYVIAEDLGKATGGPMLNKIVRVIAQEGKPMESSEIARKVGKPQNYIQSYLRHLSDYDVITRVDRGVYRLVDNVISQCIAKNSL